MYSVFHVMNENSPNIGPLSGVTILELSDGVAGAYAGRLLTLLGARLVKIEGTERSRLRTLGPFPSGVNGEELGERGGLHLALDAGKESVVLETIQGSCKQELTELLVGAHAVISSNSISRFASFELTWEEIEELAPWMVVARHSPFGEFGPYSDWKSSEIVDYAMGGYMSFSGDPEREPLLAPGFQGELHAGMQIALSLLAGLLTAQQTGRGQEIEISTFESLLNAHSWLTSSWTHEGVIPPRKVSAITPCLDGHVFWMATPNPEFFLMIERPELLDDSRLDSFEEFREAVPEYRQAFSDWAADKSKNDIYHLAQKLRIAVTPVNTADDLLKHPHLEAREFWHVVNDGARDLQIPGAPWTLTNHELTISAKAPRLGQHDGLKLPRVSPLQIQPDSTEAPLRGVTVLEITANWAGPLTGRHLADLGATVLKIEVDKKPATRAVVYPGQQPWNTGHNRAAYFNLLNRNKKGIGLDLSTPQGKELFMSLVEKADVLIENNSPRVMPNLGLSYEVLEAVNPNLIMCSMSGMGMGGPEEQYIAYGSNIEASSGFVSSLGYSEDELFSSGSFYADPICGSHGTVAILALLLERQTHGTKRSNFVGMSLQESGIIFNVESIMNFHIGGVKNSDQGNFSATQAPHGVYPTVGLDSWISLSCESDEAWQRLLSVIAPDNPIQLPERELVTLAGRIKHKALIDQAIAEWSSSLDHNQATRILQSNQIAAGPVLQNWEIVSDPHLFHRDYFVDIVHSDTGHHRWDGRPWKFSYTTFEPDRPAPLFGEHTLEIVNKLNRYEDSEIEELLSSRVIQDDLAPPD